MGREKQLFLFDSAILEQRCQGGKRDKRRRNFPLQDGVGCEKVDLHPGKRTDLRTCHRTGELSGSLLRCAEREKGDPLIQC